MVDDHGALYYSVLEGANHLGLANAESANQASPVIYEQYCQGVIKKSLVCTSCEIGLLHC